MGMHTRKLHQKLNQWRGEDASRAEETGEQRADIKSFLELTGWNKTALAFIRRLDKMSEEKRNDVLRSLDDLRGEMQPVWDAGETPDMFGHNSDNAEDEPVDYSEPGSMVDDGDVEDPDQDEENFGEDEEQAEFDAHLGEVTDENGSVVPFGATRRA